VLSPQSKVEGIKHEFSTIDHVVEDVSTLSLMSKNYALNWRRGEEPIRLYINTRREGQVTAADIDTQKKATIMNKNLVIATFQKKRNSKWSWK